MLRYLVFSFGLCFFTVVSVLAQEDPFTRVPLPPDTTISAGVSWADMDNDGDLDIFVTSTGAPNQLYRNDGGDIANDIGSSILSGGATWGDYDNDGLLDLFVANSGGKNNFLYKNKGNGVFEKITSGEIVTDGGNSFGATWGDYDNDGYLDLFVSNFDNNFLYRNHGDGSFEKILEGDIVNDVDVSSGCSWADYDSDGYLDLFVCSLGQKNCLYRNKGDGSFERILEGEITNDVSASLSCSWGDFDNDLDLDLFVATLDSNLFYKNNGNGTFTKITEGDIVNETRRSFGSAWGDFDNDGHLDLFVANEGDNSLFKNNGDGTFTRVIASIVTSDGGLSRGSAWADFNDDGQLDLFVTNLDEANFLYSNNGNQNHWINIKCVGTGTLSNKSAIGAKVKVIAAGKRQLNEISGQTGFGGQNSLNAEFGLGAATVIDSIRVEWPSGIKQVLTDVAADQFITIIEDSTLAAPFTRITEGEIANDTTYSSGASWADIDNDDDLDLFVPNNPGNNNLHLNNGDGTFTKILTGSIVQDGGESTAATWGDYNNDGFIDLFVANLRENNFLYKNKGDGTFEKITSGSIVTDGGASQGCSWVDYNNDGYLDLFVANTDGENNFLYKNNGDGTFEKISDGEIVNSGGRSETGCWADFNGDGHIDLFVVNSLDDANHLFLNNGDETFTKIVFDDGVLSVGCSGGDYDNDLDQDLFITSGFGHPNVLFKNNGDATFVRVTEGEIVDDIAISLGSAWTDFDFDGDLDLIVANFGNDFLYTNNGDGTFNQFFAGSVVTDGGVSSGCAWSDYDLDGDLDLFIANGYLGLANEPNFLYSNNGNQNHWINIKCVGTVSNKSAIGAKVKVKAAGKWQLNEISGQTGFGGQNSLNAEFGLGAATVIDSIKVEWPSGVKQVLTNVAADQFITITEETLLTINSIQPPSLQIVDFDSPVQVSANVTANLGIQQVLLKYRQGGESTFQPAPMTLVGGSHTATIPDSVVGTRGVEFQIEATDLNGNRQTSNLTAIRVDLTAGVLEQVHRGGDKSTFYRLRSMPLEVNDPSILKNLVLPVNLVYDKSELRIFDIDPTKALSNRPFREFPAPGFTTLSKGNAVFYITRTDVTLENGDGVTVNTIEDFEISLRPGWNMFASPFAFKIPRENVDLGGLETEIITHNENGYVPVVEGQGKFLEAWEGYLIFNDSTQAVTLSIHPSEGQLALPPPTLKSTVAADWFIDIKAQCDYARDNYNTVGIIADADMEWDRHERYEPPPIGAYISVNFPRNKWQAKPNIYRTDFRPPTSEGYVWEFEVETNFHGEAVTLDFENLESLPANFEIRLEDGTLNQKVDLQNNRQYIFSSSPGGKAQEFRIIAGTSNFVGENTTIGVEIPETFELVQNFPNPFNPSTTIRFGLPQSSRVVLKIYNVLGQEVATLLDGVEKVAGNHNVVWDGKDQLGRAVSSGIYLYQMRAGNVVLTRKMTLLK